ncbi:MAG: hypothetical protein AAFR23_01230, partial [Pseudomonadota bacterium]
MNSSHGLDAERDAFSARQLRAQGVIAAGGSLAEPKTTLEPRAARRIWLFTELILFYVGAPLLIMTAIPFAYAGAVFGHQLFGVPMAMFSFFGIAAAGGVVIND